DLKLSGTKTLTVTFAVHNEGPVAGRETAQVYLTSAAGEKVKRLIGFAKVELRPNGDEQARVTVDPRLLSNFDEKSQRWHLRRGEYRVEVGASSLESSLAGDIHLQESWRKP
ncbi:MAG TPA: fibronectin type III-like domain-contianing protein, partial [Steroidobacteraceae bacterium]